MALLGGASHVREFPVAPLGPNVGTVVSTMNSEAESTTHTKTFNSAPKHVPAEEPSQGKEGLERTSSRSDRAKDRIDAGFLTTSVRDEGRALQSLSNALSKYKNYTAQAQAVLKAAGRADREREAAKTAAAGAEAENHDAKTMVLKEAQLDLKSGFATGASAAAHATLARAEKMAAMSQKKLEGAKLQLRAADRAQAKAADKAAHVLEKLSKYEEQVNDARQQVQSASSAVKQARAQQVHEEKLMVAKVEGSLKRAQKTDAQLEKLVPAVHSASQRKRSPRKADSY